MEVPSSNISSNDTQRRDVRLHHEQKESPTDREFSSAQEELSKCRTECHSLEEKCHQLELERDEARDEVRGLEREIEELQDSFKEEESEQFEQLKQELELANKNCKILQIRLAKADRQYGQLEQVKISLERQLSEWTTSNQQVNASSRNASQLNEENERVRDLQEQVRYSQEEAQLKGERLAAVEQENELLLARISNLTTAVSRLRVKSQTSGELDQSSLFNLESLIEQNEQLKLALEMSLADTERLGRKCNELSKLDDASNQLETDLVSGLRKQLETAESELVRVRARVVELDRENARLQSQYKRLQEFVDSCRSDSVKHRKLPQGAARDAMGRQELRDALSDLERENEHLVMALQMKEKSSDESRRNQIEQRHVSSQKGELEQNESMKQRIKELESSKESLEADRKLLERGRQSMEEEVAKLRQLNEELRDEKRELGGKLQSLGNRCRDYQLSLERLRVELAEAQRMSSASAIKDSTTERDREVDDSSERPVRDPAVLARDLGELRTRNAFLMRQLELARQDSARELEEERKCQETQRKRAVELALLEMREQNLADCQLLRDELAELKERLATCQRDLSRAEEELEGERERDRATARERRREKAQFQQKLEELESRLGLERRASELRLKELESGQRDKERELTNVQERCLQVERELKRAQNKYHSHLESCESQMKSLSRELESKRRELAEASSTSQMCADKNYELTKRFNQERATLVETLESMKRSYEENLTELERARDRLSQRQKQLFQERQMSQKKMDELGAELCKAMERQFQAKADREMLEVSERRLESVKVELARVKEERQRLRSRVEDLEKRCVKYEKQELANKTSSILSVKQPLLGSSRLTSPFKPSSTAISNNNNNIPAIAPTTSSLNKLSNGASQAGEDGNMLEKLASKIRDQRHLTDTLQARNEQLQSELRQTRLMHNIERSKWSTRETILTARINECEERLMIEASLLSGGELESIRERVELQWDNERRQSLDTICQQQSQLESMSRDFRRLTQSHELLKLQVRQLEDNNRKLASRLMEGERSVAHSPRGHNQNLISEQARLINEDARPLLNLVTKVLDGAEKSRRSVSSENSNIPKSSERPLVASKSSGIVAGQPSSPTSPSKTSTIKRLKPKSSTLGLTVSEKQQLRQHLENLSCTLDELDASLATTRLPSSTRAISELNTRAETPVKSSQANNEQPAQYRASSMGRAIQWLDTSDAESDSPSNRRFSYNAPSITKNNNGADIRNNISTSKLSSLTDYESESSLISELSCPPSSSFNGSDLIGAQKVKRKSGGGGGGLKNRFTNTLRSISRSISALTSDSESEKPPSSEALAKTKKKEVLKEIRV